MAGRCMVPGFEVEVRYRPDVCIVGAGAAGISAAVAAARLGLSVLLVEKYGFSGGATVAGLSGTICGLFSSGSRPEQIVFGFADEFYKGLRSRNGVVEPVPFGKTLLVPHDSLSWKELADELLVAGRCTVLYHTHFVKAYPGEQEGSIRWLLLKDPEGHFAVWPKFVIDASGDAEVVHSLEFPVYYGRDGVVQTPTMIFKMGNVDMNAFLSLHPAALNEQVAAADRSGKYRLPRHHVYAFPLPHSGEVLCNMTRITYPDGTVPVGTYSVDLTYAEIEGRKQAREYARFLKDNIPAFNNAYLQDTGVQIGIRQTRSIVGEQMLLNEHVADARKSVNAITLSAWPIEVHLSDKLIIHYIENDHYDIPFETLIPKNSVNILVAGRCLSAEHEALASARVTAQCFGMGYGAGAACALGIRENIRAGNISGLMVNDWMRDNKLKTVNDA